MECNKKIIGILPTYTFGKTNNQYDDVYKFVSMYSAKIFQSGAIPIGILLNNEELDESILDECDGFIIPGGNRVYSFIHKVIYHCLKKNKPVLGICLGAEAIDIFSDIYERTKNIDDFPVEYDKLNKENDGTLLKKLEGESYNLHSRDVTYDDTETARHMISIKKDSHLYNIYGEKRNVVSMHSYDFKMIGNEFEVTAFAEDKVSECIEFKDKNYFILGVHFHPELETDSKIFDYFINEVNKRQLKSEIK